MQRPYLIFDKSSLESLNIDEAVLLDTFFSCVITHWWRVAVRALLALAFGSLTFFLVGITLRTLVLLFGAYAAADGLFSIPAFFPPAPNCCFRPLSHLSVFNSPDLNELWSLSLRYTATFALLGTTVTIL